MKKSFLGFVLLMLILLSAVTAIMSGKETSELRNNESSLQEASSDYALIKNRYIRFLIGTDKTFTGKLGAEAGIQLFRSGLLLPAFAGTSLHLRKQVQE